MDDAAAVRCCALWSFVSDVTGEMTSLIIVISVDAHLPVT